MFGDVFTATDGAEVMAFRSNVAAMAKFVFRRIDPHFAERAQEWGGGFIVGGHNYGQGSSREHYSLCRCGQSKNKPFCSGMHWYVNFHDDKN